MSQASPSNSLPCTDEVFSSIDQTDASRIPSPSSPNENHMNGGLLTTPEVADASPTTAAQAEERRAASGCQPALGGAWSINFSPPGLRRKTCAKERHALLEGWLRRSERKNGVETNGSRSTQKKSQEECAGDHQTNHTLADSEGNVVAVSTSGSVLHVVTVDGLEDRSALIPTNLHTKRADLEKRLVLRLPRLLCITKQYPRSCGISSLTSIYNYLYSGIGETAAYAHVPPVSQEEIMTILGFQPPFGEIPWGSFTGNATLIRWFHALNRYFGRKGSGSAHILYKAHGQGKTTHLYESDADALDAVKKALADPCSALIYHCHNHYMVPVGYQDIPIAQTDFYSPQVTADNCETTIFIGEVSRGKHEAMYARKWSLIKKDIECQSPYFFNIRHPEQGVQMRTANARRRGVSATEKQQTESENENVHFQNASASDPIVSLENEVSSPLAQRVEETMTTNGDSTAAVVASSVSDLPWNSTQGHDDGGDVADQEASFMVCVDGSEATGLRADVGPIGDSGGPSHLNAAEMTAPLPIIASLITKKTKPKREPGNLHCLIVFRSDKGEDDLSKYELCSADDSLSMSDNSEVGRK